MDLYKLYSDCISRKSANTYPAQTFPVVAIAGTRHFIGVDKDDFPMVFVECQDNMTNIPDICLKNLTVNYNTACKIFTDKQLSTRLSVITLKSDNEYLQKWFFDLICLIIGRLNALPTTKELSDEVDGLVSIFAAMKHKSKETIEGLWGELLVIERSTNPEFLIDAWHRDKSSKYDFSTDCDKLEVKTTGRDKREHAFSLAQLNPTQNSRVVIASVVVDDADSSTGCSVKDLIDKIRPNVSSAACTKLLDLSMDTMGDDYEQIFEEKFSYTTGVDMLKYFDSDVVPKINDGDVPDKVSAVKFTSNLEGVDCIDDWTGYDNSALYQSIH